MKFTFEPESKPLEGYTIKRAIQRGGFGEVYYALSDAGKEVALKLIRDNMEIELRGVGQCLNLKHPNLVTIFDIKTDADDDHWVVMEYVSGQSLDKALAENPDGLPIEKVQFWLDGIASGVGFLHDRGIVHRDLKPANIYQEAGVIKTGDVGLSKFITPSRRSAHTQSVGTVYYMAPEVAKGRYGLEVDVYGLGIMLYEMLTGRVPFDGETTAEILMKHLSEKPDLNPLPARLRPVVARALEKDPMKRTPSVTQLAQEFKNATLGIEIPMEIPGESFTAAKLGADTDASKLADTPRKSPHRETERPNRGRPVNVRVAQQPTPADYRRGQSWFWTGFVVVAFLTLASRARIDMGGMAICAVLGYGAYRLLAGTRYNRPSYGNVLGHAPGRAHVGDRRENGIQIADQRAGNLHGGPRVRRAVRQHPWYSRHMLTPETRRHLSISQRVTELTGSMALAALVTAVITAGLATFSAVLENSAQIGLFSGTTLLASWAILLTSKFSEGRGSEAFPRRVAQMFFGLWVGGGAFWLSQTLMVDLPVVGNDVGVFQSVGTHPLLTPDRQPTPAAFIAFFGSLFFLRRWWWHADTFRPKRLRVMSLLLTMLLAYLMSLTWSFPLTWAMLWAVTISSVVQIASVWVPHEDRREYVEGKSNAV